MTRFLSLFLALLLTPLAAIADPITMIELQHRPAEEIIPIIKPMLDQDASISGQGFTLLVRTSRGNLEQIKALIVRLDSAPQQLLVSVFQGSDQALRAVELDSTVRHQDGDLGVRIGEQKRGSDGAVIAHDSRDTQVDAHALSTRARLTDSPIHRVRVIEGSEAFIKTGQSVPYVSGRRYQTPSGPVVDTTVEFQDVSSGFYVSPRVHGDQVTLQISPFRRSLGGAHADAIETRSATTTVTGTLGQWLLIGGVDEQLSRSGTGIGNYAATRERNAASIWIKAELIK